MFETIVSVLKTFYRLTDYLLAIIGFGLMMQMTAGQVPNNTPLAMVLVAVVAALTIWTVRRPFYRRIHAHFAELRKRERIRLHVEVLLTKLGVQQPRFTINSTATGIVIRVRLGLGVNPDSLTSLAPYLQSDFKAHAVRAVHDVPNGTVVFDIQNENPLERPVTAAELPEVEKDLAQPVVVGIREDGAPARVDLWAQTLLVGGSPGSGKSVFGWVPILHAASDPSVILVMVDLKPSAIESAPIHARANVVASTAREAHQAMADVWQLVNERNAKLLEMGFEKVPKDDRLNFPPVVIVVDEAAELTRSEDEAGKAALELLTRIVAVGRASGVSVMLMTQKPDATVLPTALRDLFAQRVCFRVGNRAQAEVILGVVGEGVRPWTIPTDNPGQGVILGVDNAQVGFKSAFVDREEIKRIGAELSEARTRYEENLWSEGIEVPLLPTAQISFGEPEKAPVRRSRRVRKQEDE